MERPKPVDAQSRTGTTYLGETVVRVEEFQPDRLKIKATFEPGTSDGWRSPDDLVVAV
ncbi:MAG: hypothetical protein ACJAQT_001639 [Akkermansiaceae bacterium]